LVVFDWITSFPEAVRLPVFLFAVLGGGGTIISVTAILAVQWRRVRLAELEAGLKQDMLQRGLSAYEIATVIRVTAAGETDADSSGRIPVSVACR
jgi:hypothetical protein